MQRVLGLIFGLSIIIFYYGIVFYVKYTENIQDFDKVKSYNT